MQLRQAADYAQHLSIRVSQHWYGLLYKNNKCTPCSSKIVFDKKAPQHAYVKQELGIQMLQIKAQNQSLSHWKCLYMLMHLDLALGC